MGRAAQAGHRPRRRGPRLHHGWRARGTARLRASSPRASRGSCRGGRSRRSTRSSTASTRSSSTPTRSARASACSSTTTCSRPAAPRRRSASSSSASAARSSASLFLIELDFLHGRERLRRVRRALADHVLSDLRSLRSASALPITMARRDVRCTEGHIPVPVPRQGRDVRAPVRVPGARPAPRRGASGRLPRHLRVPVRGRPRRARVRTTSSTGHRSASAATSPSSTS